MESGVTREEHLDGLIDHLPKPKRIEAMREMIERGFLNDDDARHFRKRFLDLTNESEVTA